MFPLRKLLNFTHEFLLIFAFLGVVFIPFSFETWNIQSKVTQFLFEDFISWMAAHFDSIYVANKAISSDSTTFYLLFVVLFFLAVLLRVIASFFTYWKKHPTKVNQLIQLVLTYYLVVIMLKYGFSKIFKAQFYLPEPNILYTPLGMLDKDLLFWSTMGVSHSYNVFMGLMEVIPALMMLYRKTRVLGLFMLSVVLLNVVCINFSFDISVKLFSSFLLFVSLLLLTPYFKKVFQFFVSNQPISLAHLTGETLISSRAIRLSLKAILILFFFTESLRPYIQAGYYNDDVIPRNPLHGAYEIVSIETPQNNLANLNLKRFFIHRDHYFIFQYEDDSMEDFRLDINISQNQFLLTNYEDETIVLDYNYSEASKSLEIKSVTQGWVIQAKVVPWRNLPLLKPLFHWTVDGI